MKPEFNPPAPQSSPLLGSILIIYNTANDSRSVSGVLKHYLLMARAWIAQGEADCPEGDVPLLAWRTSRMPWRADVDLNWLVGVLAELETLRRR